MPITRSFEVIVAEMDEVLEKLSNEWRRMQTRNPSMKQPMDDLIKLIESVKFKRAALIKIDDKRGNCKARQMAKHITERTLIAVHKCMVRVSKY